MEAYTGFAQVYDAFMDNIPYDKWTDYVVTLLNKYEIKDGLVLDLGCGTGNITERLAKRGFDMIGIDNSEEMLMIAMEKKAELEETSLKENDRRKNTLYLLQDMREFELYGTVAAVVSVCDSMNYIMEEEDLLEVFHLANNYLDPRGLFVFDMKTEYFYANVLANNTIAENRDDCSFIWNNNYYSDECVNEYDLTIYAKDDEDETIFRRFDETHYQRAYAIDKVKELLEEAGMEFVACYDAFTMEPAKENSERIYFVAREKRQSQKFYIEQ